MSLYSAKKRKEMVHVIIAGNSEPTLQMSYTN